MPIKAKKLESFQNQVLNKVKLIPQGKVVTYKLLAEVLNRPKAARAVGNALNKNTCLVKIPCHRVVKSSGQVGGYVAGSKKKLSLLKKEGIEIESGNKINLKRFLYQF
ncbi:MAG: MGMT family protein [Patescibacteria group bacterium]